MATFKAIIKKEKMRSDKTWNVLIRLTHERKIRYMDQRNNLRDFIFKHII